MAVKEVAAETILSMSAEDLLRAYARKVAEEQAAKNAALLDAKTQERAELSTMVQDLEDQINALRADLSERRRALLALDREIQELTVDVEALTERTLRVMQGQQEPARPRRSAGSSGAKAVSAAKVLWSCDDHPVRAQDLSHFAFVHLHRYGGTELKAQYGEPDGHVLEVVDPAGLVHHVRANPA